MSITCSITLLAFVCAFPSLEARTHMPTPWGLFPQDCVRQVPSGTHLSRAKLEDFPAHCPGSIRKAVLEKFGNGTGSRGTAATEASGSSRKLAQFPPDYDGWLAFTSVKSNDSRGFNSFLGTFTVPPEPTSSPDVLYLFTGLQNVNWIPKVDPIPPIFDIIQPVLQYPTGFFGGWSYKSWYVSLDAGAVYSADVECKAGDRVFGSMVATGSETWEILTQVVGKPSTATSISVTHPRLKTQLWAYNTLECYGCTGCDTEPSGHSHFANLNLSAYATGPIPPTQVGWKTFKSPHPKCSEKAVVNSDGTVDIFFDSA